MPPTIPETLPERDELTTEQEKLVQQFIEKFLSDKANLPKPYVQDKDDDEVLWYTAYKFLVARKWVFADAEQMFTDSIAYRESIGFDGNPVFPSCIPCRGYDFDALNKVFGLADRQPSRVDKIYNATKRCQHIAFHKWDKAGHPILIDCAGKANVNKLVAKFKELTPPGQDVAQASIDLHTFQNMVGAHLVKYQDRTQKEKFGRRITTATVIMDCKGLGFGHLFGEAIEITKKAWAPDAKYFPEGMHRMFVVNCPSMIMFAYNLFKGMIDKRTQEKVLFCSPEDTPHILRQVIAEDCLPEFLGGKCKCEGGCVYDTNEADDATAEDASNDDIKTEEITVGAGAVLKREFKVEASHQIVWAFESSTGSDIEFSVTFTPADKAQKPVTVVAANRCKVADDSYTAPSSGTLTVQWSNAFSWLNSKTLRLRVAKLNDKSGGFDPASPTTAVAPTMPQ